MMLQFVYIFPLLFNKYYVHYYKKLVNGQPVKGCGVAEWLTRRTDNFRIARRMGFKPNDGQAVVSLSKKLYTYCSVLVGPRNGFESVPISF